MEQNFGRLLLILGVALLGLPAVAWSPDSAPPILTRPECHPQLWSWRLLDERDPSRREVLFKEWQERCGPDLKAGLPRGLNAQKLERELEGGPWAVSAFAFDDARQGHLSGWTLMQAGNTRRPTVLIACGMSCDPNQDPWLKSVVMHLYEEGPFHLIAVDSPESLFSERWLAGGIGYGEQLHAVGYWLQTASPLRARIESLHLLGRGWSAHATLYAQLFNDSNPIADDRKVFQGALHVCPVVKLKPALGKSSSLTSDIGEGIFQRSIRFDSWKSWLSSSPENEDLDSLWPRLSILQIKNAPLRLAPFRDNPPLSVDRWLEASDFAIQGLHLRTPGWAVGASHDPLLPREDHLEPLALQNRDRKKSQLKVAEVEDDSSCSWPVSLGWATSGAIYRALLLSESYEIWPRQARTTQTWQGPSPSLDPDEQHLEQTWSVDSQGQIQLTFWIGSLAGPVRSETFPVDPSLLPKDLRRPAQVDFAVQSWGRALNVRLRLNGSSGPLIQSRESAKQLVFWKW